jgi:hypothetical protein
VCVCDYKHPAAAARKTAQNMTAPTPSTSQASQLAPAADRNTFEERNKRNERADPIHANITTAKGKMASLSLSVSLSSFDSGVWK